MFDLVPFSRGQKILTGYFDELEKNLFGKISGMTSDFKTDILDQGDQYSLKAELPGFSKEDIHIDINGEYLIISAENKSETEEKAENFIRKERRYGSFYRSFNISDVKTDEIKAKYEKGILELSLPKKEQKTIQPHKIDIE